MPCYVGRNYPSETFLQRFHLTEYLNDGIVTEERIIAMFMMNGKKM